ncbi:MAG: c-type cytochrome [Bdellovibrionales bacterium]|nr:c-type cytochrome [Bdellovibrionales bacterium]
MADHEKDQVRQTKYDGIEEYDNQLPTWWKITFYITLVFGFFYWMFYYTFDQGRSQKELLEKAQASYQEKVERLAPKIDQVDFAALSQDAVILTQGHEVFESYCKSCHGDHAQGLIGPNLTDEYWIHGGEPREIVEIIEKGVIEKGMTPWKGVLSSTDIYHVVAYVLSLEGSEPSNAKAPQGEKYIRKP